MKKLNENEKVERKRKVEVLNGYIWLDENIRSIEEKIEEINTKIYAIKRQQLSSEGSKGNKEKYVLEEMIDKKIKYCSQFQEELTKNYSKKANIEKQIYAVSNELQKNVLIKKYMHNMTYAEIAEEALYSEKQVIRIHNRAVDIINL